MCLLDYIAHVFFQAVYCHQMYIHAKRWLYCIIKLTFCFRQFLFNSLITNPSFHSVIYSLWSFFNTSYSFNLRLDPVTRSFFFLTVVLPLLSEVSCVQFFRTDQTYFSTCNKLLGTFCIRDVWGPCNCLFLFLREASFIITAIYHNWKTQSNYRHTK